MSASRVAAVSIAAAAVPAGIGALVGRPAQLGVVAAVVFVSIVAVSVVRELAARTEEPPRAPRATAAQPALEQLREVAAAVAAAEGSRLVDRSLQGLLRSIAAARLERRGVDLDRDLDRARALLGDDLWQIVRSQRDREPRVDVGRVDAGRLEELVGRLETI